MIILGILPESIGGRLTTSSILDGFKLLGHDVFILDKLKPTKIPDKNYDCIVSYDFTAIKYKKDNNLNLKTINYFSDEIRNKTSGAYWDKYVNELNNPENYIFYWDRELTNSEKFPNIYYLSHFVNTNIYKNYNKSPENDVMFAGRLDTEYRLSLIEYILEQCPNLKIKWFAIEKHLNDALKRTKYPELINKIYAGFIDNEKDMADAINNTKIVINMNSQGKSSLNYRSIQTLACERLLISDKRDELDLFDNKIPVYNRFEDIPHLINYYLENKKEYKNIVQHCCKICQKEHNSIIGVEYILKRFHL